MKPFDITFDMKKLMKGTQKSLNNLQKRASQPFSPPFKMHFPAKKKMSYPMAWLKHDLKPFGNIDGDHVPNLFDCKPFDIKKQDATWCSDIGMLHISRSRQDSCKHRTKACAGCYNINIENRYKNTIAPADIKNDADWYSWTGAQWRDRIQEKTMAKSGRPLSYQFRHKIDDDVFSIEHKGKQLDRVRLMQRGEAFKDETDITRVKDILKENPDTVFWIPTRAWTKPHLRELIEKEIMPYENVRVNASLDYSNVDKPELLEGIRGKWSTMYFGIDEVNKNPLGETMVKCPKTFDHKLGHCATCEVGCFNKGVTNVHLKAHSIRDPKVKAEIEYYTEKARIENPEWFDEDEEAFIEEVED